MAADRDGRVLLTSFDASTGKDVSTKEFTLEEPKPMEQRGILNGHLVLASPRQLCILDVTGTGRRSCRPRREGVLQGHRVH